VDKPGIAAPAGISLVIALCFEYQENNRMAVKEQFSRMALLYGDDVVEGLRKKRVAVFGVGGVGGNAVEALARSGIGTLDLFDNDCVSLSNINRQIFATLSRVGEYKVDVAAERIRDIDPDIVVNRHKTFYLPEDPESEHPDFSQFDYVIDAIDTVTGKIGIIQAAKSAGTPVISCMGCGNRTDPTKLAVCDIYDTKNDPLARVMRKELRKRGIESLTVVYSTEPAVVPLKRVPSAPGSRKFAPGSSAFVPEAAGILAASVVVRELTGFDPSGRTRGGKQ
jgi:tRNA A37 threonylcarbamoyladenosine dehydratase